MGSCECGASPSWLWYTLPSGPTLDDVFLLHYQESHFYKYIFQTNKNEWNELEIRILLIMGMVMLMVVVIMVMMVVVVGMVIL
jgi:hypothetical protein